MYINAGGYITAVILSKFKEIDVTTSRKHLSSLKMKGYIKLYQNKPEYESSINIYLLTKKTIQVLETKESASYLGRIIQRNEPYDLVLDKLKLANFVATFSKKDYLFIAPFDKRKLLVGVYKMPDKQIKADFSVKKGERVYFNDAQFLLPETKYKKLHICLFPRSNVVAKTFLTDFLISQYYFINFHLKSINNVELEFYISCYDKGRLNEFEYAISHLKLTHTILEKRVQEQRGDLFDFYRNSEQKNAQTSVEIPLKSFNVKPLLLGPYI